MIVCSGCKETVEPVERDSLMGTVAVWLACAVVVFVGNKETDESIEGDSLLDTVAVWLSCAVIVCVDELESVGFTVVDLLIEDVATVERNEKGDLDCGKLFCLFDQVFVYCDLMESLSRFHF